MPEIGKALAHYTLEEKIGRGGMGDVYKAKDQKLGRDVAIYLKLVGSPLSPGIEKNSACST